jgi:alpha-L-rhamnosidase
MKYTVIFALCTWLFAQTLIADTSQFTVKSLVETEVNPVEVRQIQEVPGGWFIDFEKAAFGTVILRATSPRDNLLVGVHLGEVVMDGQSRINRLPGGSRRYRKMELRLKQGTHWYRVAITPDERNTGPNAIKMPEDIGEVMPFRYCELEDYPGVLRPSDIRQIRVHYPFDDEAAYFESSNPVLNDVWELCKYSIKATSFAGVYVDGDRERIPYEGDAYINQLSHYCLDTEYTMARRTLEYLMDHPTWPVEWHQHIPLIVWEEYLYTGDLSFLKKDYDRVAAKLLQPLAREDGLLEVSGERMSEDFLRSIAMTGEIETLVDWPWGERDGHEILPVDSVVNAYYYRGLVVMSRMAEALGKEEDAKRFHQEAMRVKQAYQEVLFKETQGIYRDGEGSEHSSLHANYFPLAFGLVPDAQVESVLSFIKTKGMATSVYGSQHLIDGLFQNGASEYAIVLLAGTGERSWGHMIYDVGTTITLEAWDNRFKPNQDWNHAWGAAPTNLIPRRLMGITPVEPGFRKVRIRPQIGNLNYAKIRHPTRLGHIDLEINRRNNELEYKISLPEAMSAEVLLEGNPEPLQIDAKDQRQEIILGSTIPALLGALSSN